MVGTNQLGALEPSLEDEPLSGRVEVMSHEKPLCAALYNENFNQVYTLLMNNSYENEPIHGHISHTHRL